jgi:hypothetical protein
MSIPASAQKVAGRLLKIRTYRVSPQQASFSAWLPALQYLLQLPVISERKRLGAAIDAAMQPQGTSVLGRIALRRPITRLTGNSNV